MTWSIVSIIIASVVAIFLQDRIAAGIRLFGDSREDTRELLEVLFAIPVVVIFLAIEDLLAPEIEAWLVRFGLAMLIGMAYLIVILRIFKWGRKRIAKKENTQGG